MYFIKKSYLTFTDQNSIKILPLSSSDCSLMSSVMPFSFLKRHFCSFQNDQDKFLLKFNNKESFYGYGPSEFLNKEGRGFVDRSLEEVVETSSWFRERFKVFSNLPMFFSKSYFPDSFFTAKALILKTRLKQFVFNFFIYGPDTRWANEEECPYFYSQPQKFSLFLQKLNDKFLIPDFTNNYQFFNFFHGSNYNSFAFLRDSEFSEAGFSYYYDYYDSTYYEEISGDEMWLYLNFWSKIGGPYINYIFTKENQHRLSKSLFGKKVLSRHLDLQEEFYQFFFSTVFNIENSTEEDWDEWLDIYGENEVTSPSFCMDQGEFDTFLAEPRFTKEVNSFFERHFTPFRQDKILEHFFQLPSRNNFSSGQFAKMYRYNFRRKRKIFYDFIFFGNGVYEPRNHFFSRKRHWRFYYDASTLRYERFFNRLSFVWMSHFNNEIPFTWLIANYPRAKHHLIRWYKAFIGQKRIQKKSIKNYTNLIDDLEEGEDYPAVLAKRKEFRQNLKKKLGEDNHFNDYTLRFMFRKHKARRSALYDLFSDLYFEIAYSNLPNKTASWNDPFFILKDWWRFRNFFFFELSRAMKLPYFFFHWPEFWTMPYKTARVTGSLLKRPFNLFLNFFERFILLEHLSSNRKTPLYSFYSFPYDFMDKWASKSEDAHPNTGSDFCFSQGFLNTALVKKKDNFSSSFLFSLDNEHSSDERSFHDATIWSLLKDRKFYREINDNPEPFKRVLNYFKFCYSWCLNLPDPEREFLPIDLSTKISLLFPKIFDSTIFPRYLWLHSYVAYDCINDLLSEIIPYPFSDYIYIKTSWLAPRTPPYVLKEQLHAFFSVEEAAAAVSAGKEELKKKIELKGAPKLLASQSMRDQVETFTDATTLPMPKRKDVLSFLKKQIYSFSSEKKNVVCFFNKKDLHFEKYNVIGSRESLVLFQNFLLRKKKKKKGKITLEDLSTGVLLPPDIENPIFWSKDYFTGNMQTNKKVNNWLCVASGQNLKEYSSFEIDRDNLSSGFNDTTRVAPVPETSGYVIRPDLSREFGNLQYWYLDGFLNTKRKRKRKFNVKSREAGYLHNVYLQHKFSKAKQPNISLSSQRTFDPGNWDSTMPSTRAMPGLSLHKSLSVFFKLLDAFLVPFTDISLNYTAYGVCFYALSLPLFWGFPSFFFFG